LVIVQGGLDLYYDIANSGHGKSASFFLVPC
jgi:hypothetical protein